MIQSVVADPFNVVKLAGKRIRTVPIEQAHEAVNDANDYDNHGVVLVVAPARSVAKTFASMESVYGLIAERDNIALLYAAMYYLPCHDHEPT